MPETVDQIQGHESDTDVNRSLRESVIYLVSRLFPSLITLVSIKIFTSLYSPDIYGIYETVLALGMIASSLGVGWLQMAYLRLFPVSEKNGDLNCLHTSVFSLLGVVFFTSAILTTGAYLYSDHPLGIMLHLDLSVWIFFIFSSSSFFFVTSSIPRAQRKPFEYAFFQTLSSVLVMIASLGFSIFWGSFAGSLVLGFSVSLLFVSGLILVYKIKIDRKLILPIEFNPIILRSILSFGLPLALHQSGSQLLNLSDRYLIFILCGERETGIYSVAYKLADFAVRFVLLSLMLTAYSAIMESYQKKGKAETEKLLESLSRLYLLLAVPVAFGCGIVQQDYVFLFTSTQYHEGASLLIWIALGDLLLGLSQYQHMGFHTANKSGLLAILTFSGVSINLISNLYLLPLYGYKIAAYTTFGTYLYLAILTPLLSKKWLQWRISLFWCLKISCATGLMSGVGIGINHFFEPGIFRLALNIAACGIVYIASLIAMKELRLGKIKICYH